MTKFLINKKTLFLKKNHSIKETKKFKFEILKFDYVFI